MQEMLNTATDWYASTGAIAMGETLHVGLAILAYVFVGNLILRPSYSLRAKTALFAVFNLSAAFLFYFGITGTYLEGYDYQRGVVLQFMGYAAFACAHWLLVAAVSRWQQRSALYWVALLYPIIPLIVVKIETVWHLIGFSYMAFRMAQAALEVRRTPDLKISFSGYAAFLFFPLTIPIGPISPYGTFVRGVQNGVAPSFVSIGRGLARIALGYVMFRLFATYAYQFSYGGMWEDGFTHGVGDALLASYGSLGYLYFNFAGFTHVVIGAAALLGIPVKENFNSPILSRSIKEFWTRWHISLSEFVRDLVYTPLATSIMRLAGAQYALLAAIIAAMATFIVIGLWHEFSLGFLLFGVMHGIGFSTNLVFDAVAKKHKTGLFAAFRRTPVWTALCWFLTITYVAISIIVIEFSTWSSIVAAYGVFEPRW